MASLQPNSETDASGLLSAALARVLEIMVLAPWAAIALLFADALEPYRYEWRISFNAQMFAYAASLRGIITLDHLRTFSIPTTDMPRLNKLAAGWLSKATSLSIEVGLREPDASAAAVPRSGAGRNDEDHVEYRCCSFPSSGYHLALARDQCAPWQFHDRTDSVGGLWRHRHCSRHHLVVGS